MNRAIHFIGAVYLPTQTNLSEISDTVAIDFSYI